MKFHGKTVISFVATDVSSHVRSTGTCRMHSHVGELARKQECLVVKILEILEYENKNSWNIFIKKWVFKRPTSVELMTQGPGLLKWVGDMEVCSLLGLPHCPLNNQALGSASFSSFELEFLSWTQETSLIIFSLKVMFTTSCFMFSGRTLQWKILESQNPGIIKIRKDFLKSCGSNPHSCSKQGQWGSGCFFNQLDCVCMYVLLCTCFISTYILLRIFAITVFLKCEVFRVILDSLLISRSSQSESVLHRNKGTAVQQLHHTLAVPGSVL